MNNEQLWKCVKQDQLMWRYCTGIYACDTVLLPRKKINSLPICYIMNTDPIALPGKHWIAVYLSIYGQHEFFDSYGRQQSTVAPYLPKIKAAAAAATMAGRSDWLENTVTLQSPHTSTCGQYCLYYLSHRCAGRQMKDIVNDFSADRVDNDRLINDYINSTFNTELDIYDEKFKNMQIAVEFY